MSPRHSGSLSTVDSLICGPDFIKTKGYRRSNLGRWSRCGGGAASGGASRPWRRLTEVERGSHYGAPFSIRFNPMDGGDDRVGRTTAVGLLKPLVTSTTSSNDWPAMRLGYVGAA
jgi:hypothetical protein